MPRATWNGTVIAEAEQTELVEGNHYFAMSDVRQDLLRRSETTSHCPWKGDAAYFDIVVGDQVNRDAAWTYPETKPEAAHLRGRIAFWNGVEIENG